MVVSWLAIKKKNIPLCCSKPWHDKMRECRDFLVVKDIMEAHKDSVFLLCMRADSYYCKYKLSVTNNFGQKLARQIEQDKTTRRNKQTNLPNIIIKTIRVHKLSFWFFLAQNTLLLKLMIVQMKGLGGCRNRTR